MSFELILPFLRPIEPLLVDESMTEIMGNPDASWWYERDGIICPDTTIQFDSNRLRTGLEVIANQLRKKLDEDNPLLNAQLPDGSRIAAVIPPVVRPAPALTIRKFTGQKFTVDDLIARATLSAELAVFGSDQIRTGKTVLISGGTGTGKFQLLWRVEAIDFERQESMLKTLAITFGGDPACTDVNRVFRLPGFLNRKYTPAPVVTVEYPSDSTWHSEDFQLADTEPNRDLIRRRVDQASGPGKDSDSDAFKAAHPDTIRRLIGPLKPTVKGSHSESDWAWVLGELARGKDPVKLTRMLAERRADKSNPAYYAQRTVDVASAWLWLRDGVPMADVVTMLQVRRRFQIPQKLCSARAHEIAFTAERMITRKKIA